MTAMLDRVAATIGAAVSAARPLCSGQVSDVRGLSVRVRGISARVGDVLRIDRPGRAARHRRAR